jgi:uncharacterized membrane protein
MKDMLITFANKYGGFVIGGLVGAIVHRLRNTMSFKKFLSVLFISAFVGFCVGIIMKNYLNASDEVIFVVCSISGVFSKDILDEIQEFIQNLSVFAKKYLRINDDSKKPPKNPNQNNSNTPEEVIPEVD